MGDCAIIIPNYCGRFLLETYLPGIVRCLGQTVTVVDDASTDDSVAYLRQAFPEVQTLALSTNSGFSVAVNSATRVTDGQFVVLLNNDVEVTPGFLDSIMPLFADESVFSVSPRIVLPSRGDMDEGAKSGFWHHGLFFTDQEQGVSQVRPILYCTGCAAVYRRSMLEELGGFDEAYSPFYWEDVDLGYRAWKRGWKSIYQPASTVYHQHSASISKIRAGYTNRIKARNALLFIWRNIDDLGLVSWHRRWLPLVLMRRAASGDAAFVRGWRDAFALRRDAAEARTRDAGHRVLSDREIFAQTGIEVPL